MNKREKNSVAGNRYKVSGKFKFKGFKIFEVEDQEGR